MEKKYDIFISYKRKSLPTANNLYYRLTTRGYSTFFDLEEMGRDNFNVQLLNFIENAKDVFVILEEGSLDGCKQENWEEKDWFCHEIAFALEKKKNIIPILLNGYQMPSQDSFPDRLKELNLKNAPEFNFSFFEAYLDKLIEKDYLLSKPNIQDKATSVFKFYSNENCQVFKEGKLVCSLEGMSDEPFYLPVPRKGDYRFKAVNDSTNEFRIINERIDSVEEKSIEITWKGRWKNQLFNRATNSFTYYWKRIADKGEEMINKVHKRLIKRILVILCAISVLLFISSILLTSGSFSRTTNDGEQDTIPPIIQVDTLRKLSIVLDSINPIELGVLSDSVLYYKKDSSFYFINQIGIPLAGGKAFDKFTITNNIIITELVTIDTTETIESSYAKDRNKKNLKKTKQQSLYGVISLNGYELLSCKYEKIDHPMDGVHTYKKGSLWGCVSDSSEILGCKFTSIKYAGIKDLLLCQSHSDNCYYFYDNNGKLKLPDNAGEKYYYAKPFSDNLALVRVSNDNNSPNCFIGTDGGKKWDPIREGYYNFESSYSNKKAKVSKKDVMGRMKYGIVDSKLQVILPCEYDAIEEFSNSAAEVKIDGKWKIVSYSQKEIANIRDYYYSNFFNGYLEVKENDETYTLYFNNKLLHRNLDYIYFYGYGDFAKVKKENSYQIINSNGDLSQPYSAITYYEKGKVFMVRDKDGNYGIIDNKFNTLVECKYKYIGDYSEGFFVAKLDSLYGYLDKGGEWVIKPKYNDAKDFRKDKLAIVKYDGKYGIIRPNKDIVVPYSYEKIIPHKLYPSIFIICKNNKYGIWDIDNKKEIVPCEFENEFLYISHAKFPVKKNGKWGIYTRDGKCTLNLQTNERNTKKM